MKLSAFPYLSAGVGSLLMLIVVKGSEPDANGSTLVPLLTLLIVSEFAFFVTAIGVFIGIKQILATGYKPLYAVMTLCCALLAIRFMWLGITLWPL